MTENQLIALRRVLHKNPELSGSEFKTTQYLYELFREHCPSAECQLLGETGLLVQYSGTSQGKKVLLRCELDALPIEEINTFDYKSIYPNISHKCGHDGHMTILFSVALELEAHPPKGDVFLVYQPAEENGEGAISVLSNPIFKQLVTVDYVFALHNLPGAELHSIHVKPHEITPAVVSATITFHGKISHAAEPQKGHNPAYFVSEIELSAITNNQTDPNREDFSIVTPIFINIGTEDFGISAGSGTAGFTLRTHNNASMERLKTHFLSLLDHLSEKYSIPYEIQWSHSFASIYNDPACAEMIAVAAQECQFPLTKREAPFPWGEDFGLFSAKFKGAMFGLGAGTDCPALHNPDYDFPDVLITSGRNMFLHLLKQAQQ